MKKLFVMIFLAVFVMSFATVEVTFWHAMGGGHGKALQEIVKMFNETHPGIEVKAIYVGNYGALSQKLLAAAQSGQLPVLSQAYSNWTAKLIHAGVVQELNKYVFDPQIGLTKDEWEDIWKPFRLNCMWGDKVYAMPFNKSLYVLFVNTDALLMYGVDAPKTVDELVADAKALTDDIDGDGKIDQYGFGFRPTVDTFQIFLSLAGGSILKKVNGKWVPNLDTPETREVLQLLKKMYDEKIAYVQGSYLSGPFGNGKIAMYIGSIAGKPYVDRASKGKHDWSWVPVPKWKTNKVPFAGTDVIMFNTASEAQKKAAWEFMKFLVSPEITAYWAVHTGYVPVRKSALETKVWKDYAASDPKANIPLVQIPNGVFDPQIGVWYEIRQKVGTMFANVIYGKTSIDDAIKQTTKEINKLLEEEYGGK